MLIYNPLCCFETAWKLCVFPFCSFKVTDQIESLEEASKHMEDAMQQFKTYEETADADPSMVTDQYLDPLHLTLEMPD